MSSTIRTSQKSKNTSFYIPHERERTSGSQEKQTLKFSDPLKLLFNIVNPCQKKGLLPELAIVILAD